MSEKKEQTYEAPTFEVKEVEASELGSDFNPADACIIVAAGITAAAIIATDD